MADTFYKVIGDNLKVVNLRTLVTFYKVIGDDQNNSHHKNTRHAKGILLDIHHENTPVTQHFTSIPLIFTSLHSIDEGAKLTE